MAKVSGGRARAAPEGRSLARARLLPRKEPRVAGKAERLGSLPPTCMIDGAI